MDEIENSAENAETLWLSEFYRICHRADFIEFYCEVEGEWLQYGGWEEHIPAIFGSFRNAVMAFRAHCSEVAIRSRPSPD